MLAVLLTFDVMHIYLVNTVFQTQKEGKPLKDYTFSWQKYNSSKETIQNRKHFNVHTSEELVLSQQACKRKRKCPSLWHLYSLLKTLSRMYRHCYFSVVDTQGEAAMLLPSSCAPLALINGLLNPLSWDPHAPSWLPITWTRTSTSARGSALLLGHLLQLVTLWWGWEAAATQLQNMTSKGCGAANTGLTPHLTVLLI